MKKLLFIGTMLFGIAACSGTGKDSTTEEIAYGALVNRGVKKNPYTI